MIDKKKLPEKEKGAEALINWDEHHMGIALIASLRSKDPSTKVGAVIVNDANKIVSTGYNGFPKVVDMSLRNSLNNDDVYPWAREGERNKYDYVVHAEANAIMSAGITPAIANEELTLYSTLFPCNECAKLIVQSGILRVIYLSDKYNDTKSCKISMEMLGNAYVGIRQFKPSEGLLSIGLDLINPDLCSILTCAT